MDSERRHELETNELREFFDNFKDFWDRHGNKVLTVLIVVLGGFAAYVQYHRWQADKQEQAYSALLNATTADQLLAVAGEHERVYDEAMRRAGDQFLVQARDYLIDGKPDKAKDPLTQAGSAYQALIDRGETKAYQLNGYEGLANVAIMQADWDKASDAYNGMIDLAGEVYLAHAERARAGLDRLDELETPIAFAPDDAFDFDFDNGDSELTPQPTPGATDDDVLSPVVPIPPVSE